MAVPGYNPYRNNLPDNNLLGGLTNQQGFFNNRLLKLSGFNRNYSKEFIKNAKGIHANEDLNIITDSNGLSYSLFSRKIHAMMQEKQTIAALSVQYQQKIFILKEYATKVEIQQCVTKMANEIIVYGAENKFCELADLPNTYSQTIREKAKTIFDNMYMRMGLADGSAGWDWCRDWLVEGYICREIVYDDKGKNIIGSMTIDPASIIPMIDEQSGIKIWIQHPYDEQNRRILVDAEIIYISYSGSSNYMETSYIEPLIRPYNELKSIERSRLLFNLINATMHKEIIIPTHGLSPILAEQEMLNVISDYKDQIQFDDTTGHIYIDGSKDLPYSKEYWFPNNGEAKPEMNIINPEGHDLNESSMLIWFYNNFKRATKFPFSRLDNTNGGGNIYSMGQDLTYDDYNFDQYIQRLRTLFKEIILKPVILQLQLDFPELDRVVSLYNDIDIIYNGHSELIKAKQLSNLEAKANIAVNLTNNLKRSEDKPLLHWMFIAKQIMDFSDEDMKLNDYYWKTYGDSTPGEGGGEAAGGGGEAAGGEDFGDEFGGAQEIPAQEGGGAQENPAQTPAQEPPAQEPPAE
jgi:hypothetical protein